LSAETLLAGGAGRSVVSYISWFNYPMAWPNVYLPPSRHQYSMCAEGQLPLSMVGSERCSQMLLAWLLSDGLPVCTYLLYMFASICDITSWQGNLENITIATSSHHRNKMSLFKIECVVCGINFGQVSVVRALHFSQSIKQRIVYLKLFLRNPPF
jgi:hypothetical protein